MMPVAQLLQKPTILDACSAISLSATNRIESILRCMNCDIYIAEHVKRREVKFLFNPVTQLYDIPIDLEPMHTLGLMQTTTWTPGQEALDVLNFAAYMSKGKPSKNMGEAISGAIALSRDWTMVTDDVDATKFFNEPSHRLSLLTTMDLIRYWEVSNKIPALEVGEALRSIRNNARYGPPPKNHHLLSWWLSFGI